MVTKALRRITRRGVADVLQVVGAVCVVAAVLLLAGGGWALLAGGIAALAGGIVTEMGS